MSEKKVVKVIKREERVLHKPSRRSARQNKRKTPTDMVSTVSGWVNDFQKRQRDETSKAIENLIRARQQPQPNEA
jgi:DNA topoisomerase VI subunit B